MKNEYVFSYEYTAYRERFGEYLTIEQAAFLAGTEPSLVRKIISHDIIEPITKSSQTVIHVKNIPILKKIIRLHYDLGIGWNSMDLVLELLDRIEKLANVQKKT